MLTSAPLRIGGLESLGSIPFTRSIPTTSISTTYQRTDVCEVIPDKFPTESPVDRLSNVRRAYYEQGRFPKRIKAWFLRGLELQDADRGLRCLHRCSLRFQR